MVGLKASLYRSHGRDVHYAVRCISCDDGGGDNGGCDDGGVMMEMVMMEVVVMAVVVLGRSGRNEMWQGLGFGKRVTVFPPIKS